MTHYEQFGPDWYDTHWSKSVPKMSPCHLWVSQVLEDPFLDVGCGPGLLLNMVQDSRIGIGVDFSGEAVEQVRRAGFSAYQASAEALPFSDETFHTVTAIEVLEHVDDLEAAISELHRVAWKQIIVTVPPNLASASHKQVWPIERWQQALGAGAPDFFDGVHVGWVLKPNRKLVSPRSVHKMVGDTLVSCGQDNMTSLPARAVLAYVDCDHEGIHMRTASESSPTSYILLADGSWHKVDKNNGYAATDECFYVCQANVVSALGVNARLFVLWYEENGKRIDKDPLVSIGPNDSRIRCAFAAPAGASHFVLAIHLGGQSPDVELILRSLTVFAMPRGLVHRLIPRKSNLSPGEGRFRRHRLTEAERRAQRQLQQPVIQPGD